MEIFSERLKLMREKKGFSQNDMAEKLGISQSYYGRFERNKGEPNLEALAKIATVLEVNSDYLIGLTDAQDTKKNAETEFDRRISALERTIVDVLSTTKEKYNQENDLDAATLFKKNLDTTK